MSTAEQTATDQRDVYSRVTSQIINAIEAGVSNWRMPWHTTGRFAFSPINVTSKKPYRGINTVCLWAAAQAKRYERGEWGTDRKWQERGVKSARAKRPRWLCSGSLPTVQPRRTTAMIRPSQGLFPPPPSWPFRIRKTQTTSEHQSSSQYAAGSGSSCEHHTRRCGGSGQSRSGTQPVHFPAHGVVVAQAVPKGGHSGDP